MWHGRLPATWNVVADTTHRSSRLSKELGVSVPYDVPWAWADAVHAEGRAGLRYWLRLDPGPGRGIAVFADAGVPDPPPPLASEPATAHADDLRTSFDIIEPTITFEELRAADPW